MVQIHYFGIAGEITGVIIEEMDAADIGDLRSQILKKYPALKNIRFRFAVNSTLLNEERKLAEGDRIALLPPFAGG